MFKKIRTQIKIRHQHKIDREQLMRLRYWCVKSEGDKDGDDWYLYVLCELAGEGMLTSGEVRAIAADART